MVWGGASVGVLHADGAAYHPEDASWEMLPDAPLQGRTGHTTVWTGDLMVVWGGCCGARGQEFRDGATYDPGSGSWTPMAAAPLEARAAHTAVWTG